MKPFNWLGSTIVAGFVLWGASIASAAPITSNPTLSTGGLTFDTFTISVNSTGSAFPTAGNQVDVALLSGAAGLLFSSNFIASNGSFSDAAITYVARGAAGISSIGLSFDGSFFGQAITAVTETVYANAAHTIEVGQVVVNCGVDIGCSRTATLNLTGSYDTLYVTKDISVTAFSGAGNVGLASIVSQSFGGGGGGVSVPEPATLALFGTGLLGLALIRRKRQS